MQVRKRLCKAQVGDLRGGIFYWQVPRDGFSYSRQARAQLMSMACLIGEERLYELIDSWFGAFQRPSVCG